MITLILADDDEITRVGIRAILSRASDIKIVDEAKNGFEVLKLVEQHQPRVLLLDLKMPGPRPAEIENMVRKKHPDTITLVLTAHDRDCYLSEMIDSGINGYLNKNQSGEQLIQAIRRAASGERLLTADQFARAHKWQLEAGHMWRSLTSREREILKLISRGLNNFIIADNLCVSKSTIAFHVSNILGKLEVTNRIEAGKWLDKYFPQDLDIEHE